MLTPGGGPTPRAVPPSTARAALRGTSAESAVARYYDANTRAFLAFGVGRRQRVIHRGVWAEGVSTRAEASHFVHDLLVQDLRGQENAAPRLLDLGCGVGASLHYILDRCPMTVGFGVTISHVQFERARATAHPQAVFLEADFCRDPLPAEIDLAYAIESFVHASDPRDFFGSVARALRAGAHLAVVDDFLASPGRSAPDVNRFVEGWHATSLLHPTEADTIAQQCGLHLLSDRDLTPHLELDRPRDYALAVLVSLTRRLAPMGDRIRSLSGGDALRRCLKRGLVTYRWRVWQKRS